MIVSHEEFWIKVAFTIFMLIMGIIFLGKGIKEEEMKSQKYFKYGLAMFALLTSVTRAFFLLSDFETVGTDSYNLFWKVAVISSMAALIFITLVIEKYLVKTYYIFTMIGIIGAGIIMFVDVPLATLLNVPLYLALGGEVFVLYIYLAIKSPGTLRTKSLLMLLSLLIFSAGILFDSESVTNALVGADLGFVGAILMWIGLSVYLRLNWGQD